MIYLIGKQKKKNNKKLIENFNLYGNINEDIYQIIADGYAASRVIEENMICNLEEEEKMMN